MPPGLIPILGSSAGVCTLTGQIVTCNLGTRAPGFNLDISLDALVDPGYAPGPITGTAFIGSDTPDTNTTNNQSSATIDVVGSADLEMTKTAPTGLIAGGEATYTLTVVNHGPSESVNVSITDNLPAGLTLISASPSIGSCAAAGQALTCTASRMTLNSSMVVSVKVAVSTAAVSPIVNTADVTSATTDPGPSPNSSSTTTPVTQAAHLVLAKSATPSPVTAGSSMTYALTVVNQGPSNAANVVIGDPMPAGVTILPDGVTAPADGTCTVAANSASVSCSFASIPVGQSRIVTVNANVAAAAASGSSLVNTATITSSGTPDPDQSTWTASTTTPVVTSADLEIVKTSLGTGVVAGDTHGYQLSVTNNGPSVSRSVRVTDPLPAGTSLVSATFPGGTCAVSAGNLTCDLGDLTAGQSVPISLTLAVAKDQGDTTLTNRASVASATTTDPDTSNNSSAVSELVNARSDLAVTKVIAGGPIVAGQPLVYSMTVSNLGVSDAVQVALDDPLPVNTTFTSATATNGGACQLVPGDPLSTPPTKDLIHCVWATLAVGETRTVTLTLGVPATVPAGTIITNTATGTAPALDTNPSNDSATVAAPVEAHADVSVTKQLVSGNAIAGATVRWQIVAANAGPSTATGVTLADVAPTGVTFTGVTTTTGTCAIAIHAAVHVRHDGRRRERNRDAHGHDHGRLRRPAGVEHGDGRLDLDRPDPRQRLGDGHLRRRLDRRPQRGQDRRREQLRRRVAGVVDDHGVQRRPLDGSDRRRQRPGPRWSRQRDGHIERRRRVLGRRDRLVPDRCLEPDACARGDGHDHGHDHV